MAVSSVAQNLAADLLNRIDRLLLEGESAGLPLEVEPQRSALFDLFVTADAMGGLDADSELDLSSDGIARLLVDRWGLARSVGPDALARPSALPAEQLKRMQTLWSFMRMWMEWTYAWSRWSEFHQPSIAHEMPSGVPDAPPRNNAP